MDLSQIPLPPPWRRSPETGFYVNEITGQSTPEHPAEGFLRLRQQQGSPREPEEEDGDGDGPGRPWGGELVTTTQPSQQHQQRKLKSWDFRCLWKELGLFGNVNSYGLTLRYFEDGTTEVRFDGLDGQWVFSQLEGTHGPIERYDLFVGAKIRVFGRHLTISSTSASTCQWIDDEGKRLLKRQDFLQQKIESVGAVPVVRRNEPIGIKCHFAKRPSGGADLRRIYMENAKLTEQLAGLGMAGAAILTV